MKKLDIPDKILAQTKHLRDTLLSTTTQKALLHCDLHHYNILQNADNSLAIDPKEFIDDFAFEPAGLMTPFVPLAKLFGSWMRAYTISSPQSGHMDKLA